MSFENHQTGTRDYIAKLEKELAEEKEIIRMDAGTIRLKEKEIERLTDKCLYCIHNPERQGFI